jgi:hypothetical protein
VRLGGLGLPRDRGGSLDPGGRRQRLQNFGLIFRFEVFERADGFALEVVARLDRAVFIGNWHRVARDAFQFRRCRAGAVFNLGHARFFACRFGSKVHRIDS